MCVGVPKSVTHIPVSSDTLVWCDFGLHIQSLEGVNCIRDFKELNESKVGSCAKKKTVTCNSYGHLLVYLASA